MIKKILSGFLSCMMLIVLFSACAPAEKGDSSSDIASSDIANSETLTSSDDSSEIEESSKQEAESKESSSKEENKSSSNKKDNDQTSSKKDKNETSSKKNETSSKKDKVETSSKKNEAETSSKNNEVETSSKKDEASSEVSSENSSEKENSSKKEENKSSSSRVTVSVNRGESSEEEIESGDSSSKGNSAIRGFNPTQALQIGAFHFNPKWTTNYGNDEDGRMRELSNVLSSGYFNTFQVELDYAANERMWEVCLENEVSVWILLYEYFDSTKTTIDEYIAKVDKAVSVIKSKPEWWENFCGFAFEESVWRGQTNEDFVAESEALYKKYGKRNHVVLATGEFTGVEGNELQLGITANEMKKMLPGSFKYCTDVAFDSYGVDVRDWADNGSIIAKTAKELPNVVDGQSYYRELTKLLVRLAGHDVNVWFYPCAYTTSLWSGGRADEDYCLAHLNFFDNLLSEQEYQGGLMLYTYTQFSNPNEVGLQSHLAVQSWNGEDLLRPNEEKWYKYSMRLGQITGKYKETKARHAD